jgi:hypothetical protein
MAKWKNSLMTTAFLDERVAIRDFCEVIIDENRIVVDYTEEDGTPTIYEGPNSKTGHFRLRCKSDKNAEATLHLVEGEDILEGYWVESGYEGFWRIGLKD